MITLRDLLTDVKPHRPDLSEGEISHAIERAARKMIRDTNVLKMTLEHSPTSDTNRVDVNSLLSATGKVLLNIYAVGVQKNETGSKIAMLMPVNRYDYLQHADRNVTYSEPTMFYQENGTLVLWPGIDHDPAGKTEPYIKLHIELSYEPLNEIDTVDAPRHFEDAIIYMAKHIVLAAPGPKQFQNLQASRENKMQYDAVIGGMKNRSEFGETENPTFYGNPFVGYFRGNY